MISIMNNISIIFTARNDDYGGNFINRINTSINVLIHLTNKYNLICELIIVDYNSPDREKKLNEILTIRNNRYLSIKFIIVPPNFHKKFNTNTPFLEWIAKNIGIYRAKGEFILVTNPDIIFSDNLVKYLKSNQLNDNCFYRINRSDISIDYFKPDLNPVDVLRLCKANIYRTIKPEGIKFNFFNTYCYFDFMKSLIYILIYISRLIIKRFATTKKNSSIKPRVKYFEGAAGDFLLVSRRVLFRAKGYEESSIRGYMDGLLLNIIGSHNLKQVILPFEIYHILHGYGERFGRDTLNINTYNQKKESILGRKECVSNIGEWGSPNEKFTEIIK